MGEASIKTSKDYWIEEFIEAQFPLIRCINGSKVPVDQYGWQHTPHDPTSLPQDYPGQCYGVVLPDNVLVIDVDMHKNKKDEVTDGKKAFSNLVNSLSIDKDIFQKTFSVATGGGGLHFYFKTPDLTANQYLRTKIAEFDGIQFLRKGHYVIGPGSIHPDSKKEYKVQKGSPSNLLNLPNPIWELLVREIDASVSGTDWQDDDYTKNLYIKKLTTMFKPAIEGENGEILTHITAKEGRDLGLSEEVTLELMLEHWNPRCEPPWEEEALAYKVASAYRSAKMPVGHKHPSAGFDKITQKLSDSEKFKQCYYKAKTIAEEKAGVKYHYVFKKGVVDEDGEPIKQGMKDMRVNVLNLFKSHTATCKEANPDDPKYKKKSCSFEECEGVRFTNPFHNMIRLNKFSNEIDFINPAPWHHENNIRKSWSDSDTSQFLVYLGTGS
jgi:hypothetical protein